MTLGLEKFNQDFFLGGFSPLIFAKKEQNLDAFKDLAGLYFPAGSDEFFMAVAIFLAHSNIKKASPNPCVGCVVVKNEEILSFGFTDNFGGAHAERVAIAKLTKAQLKGSSIYVTLEPCSHHGKQPPCTDLIIESNISKVIVSSQDKDRLVNGNGFNKLKDAGIEIKTNVLTEANSKLLSQFFRHRESDATVFVGKWAQSIDGCLCDHNGASKWISGSKSRKYTHWLRNKYDAIMVGSNTAINDFPKLDIRESFNFTNEIANPIRIIIDPNLKLLEEEDFIKIVDPLIGNDKKLAIFIGEKPTKFNSDVFQKNFKHIEKHLITGIHKNNLVENIQQAIGSEQFISKFGKIMSCLVEGGPTLHSLFLDRNIYSFCHIFIAPMFLGGSNNIIQNLGNFPADISKSIHHSMVSQGMIENDTLIEISINAK